jgi:hypothetical protein
MAIELDLIAAMSELAELRAEAAMQGFRFWSGWFQIRRAAGTVSMRRANACSALSCAVISPASAASTGIPIAQTRASGGCVISMSWAHTEDAAWLRGSPDISSQRRAAGSANCGCGRTMLRRTHSIVISDSRRLPIHARPMS